MDRRAAPSNRWHNDVMHKDDHCTAEAVWADRIEDVVLKDLFRISADMEKAIDPGRYAFANPLEEMQQQVKRLEAKLKRLYNLYADSENDTLMAAIKENEDTLAVLKEDCEAEEKNQFLTSPDRHCVPPSKSCKLFS